MVITKAHFIYLLTSASIFVSFTYIPIFMDELGLGKEHVTLVAAFYSFFLFLSSSLAGRGSDRYGRRIFLYLGLLLSTVAFTSQFFASDFLSVLFARLLAGFSVGIYLPALIAYAYENRSLMGKFSSLGALGWGLGTIVGGIVASFSTGYVFMMAGLLYFVGFLVALKLPTSNHNGNDNLETFTAQELTPSFTVIKNNLAVYTGLFLRHSAAFALWTLWPLFLKGLGFDNFQIGIVQATNSLTQFVAMFFISDRIRAEVLQAAGSIISALTFITFLLTTNFYLFLITQVFLGISWTAMYVGAVKYVTEKNQMNERGTASGFLNSTISIAGLAGPAYVAVFLFLFGDAVIYFVLIVFAAMMSFISFFAYIGLLKLTDGRKETEIIPS
ncbi:MAG: MFS transporter [Candidatus Odinarchaeota archaeon]